MSEFRVGVTNDLRTASGEPCFSSSAFDELAGDSRIVWEWIDETIGEITPDICARYDALHVNLPLVTAESVARQDCRVRIVARNGVGYDTVDVDAMTERGIIVTNTPVAVRRPVAVAAMTLLFALAGRLRQNARMVQEGRWNDRVEYMGTGLTGRTLGVVGAGSIGKELIRLARPFFGEILAADPYVSPEVIADAGAKRVGLEELLDVSDFVVVCALLNEETTHLIDEAAFARMKPEAYFLNVGRGPIHDEKALAAALAEGRLAGAGLDVTEVEPIPADSPLLEMDNVIVTAHALCWTDECFEDIARTALRSVADVAAGRRPVHVVNPDAAESLLPRD